MKRDHRFLKRLLGIFLSVLLLLSSTGNAFAAEASQAQKDLLQRYMFTNLWMGVDPGGESSHAIPKTAPPANKVLRDSQGDLLSNTDLISSVYAKGNGTYVVYLSSSTVQGINGLFIEKVISTASSVQLQQGFAPESRVGLCVVKVSDAFEIQGEPEIVGPNLEADENPGNPRFSVEKIEKNVLLWKMDINLKPLYFFTSPFGSIPIPRKNTIKITVKAKPGIYGTIAPLEMAAMKHNRLKEPLQDDPPGEEIISGEYPVAYFYMPVVALPEPSKISLQTDFYADAALTQRVLDAEAVDFSRPLYVKYAFNGLSIGEVLKFKQDGSIDNLTFHDFEGDGAQPPSSLGADEEISIKSTVTGEGYFSGKIKNLSDFTQTYKNSGTLTVSWQKYKDPGNPGDPEDGTPGYPDYPQDLSRWNMVTEKYFTDQEDNQRPKQVLSNGEFPYYQIINHVQEDPESYDSTDDAHVVEKEKVTVTFSHNYSDSPADLLRSVTSGSSLGILFPGNPVRPGYNFLGWVDNADGSGNAFTQTTAVTGNKTVYAKWEQIPVAPPVTVTFKENYPSSPGDLLLSTTTSSSLGILFPPSPVREGYEFLGWYDNEEGTGSPVSGEELVGGNRTLYAKWRKLPVVSQVIVTFDHNDPGNPGDISRFIPSHTVLGGNFPADPVRAGYRFLGWFDEFGVPFTKDTLVTGNKKVYAKWEYQGSPGSQTGGSTGGEGTFFAQGMPGSASGTAATEKPSLPEGSSVPLALNKEDHFAYVTGYPDHTFRPLRSVSRGEVASMFALISVKDTGLDSFGPTGFNDVKVHRWFYPHIRFLEKFQILSGYPDGSFRPDQPITRAEFVAIASKFNAQQAIPTPAFGDVTDQHWALSFVSQALQSGWITGYPDGSFKPDQHITRAEAVTILNKMLERRADRNFIDTHPDQIKQYTDVAPSYWAYGEIHEASNAHEYEKRGAEEIWTHCSWKSR